MTKVTTWNVSRHNGDDSGAYRFTLTQKAELADIRTRLAAVLETKASHPHSSENTPELKTNFGTIQMPDQTPQRMLS